MLRRQRLPLALMYAHPEDPIEGRTRLQKMIFLLQKKFEEDDGGLSISHKYSFTAYDYGPFSQQLYADLDELRGEDSDGERLVVERSDTFDRGKVKYQYELTPAGTAFIENELADDDMFQEILRKAEEIKEEFNQLSLSQVIERVYTEYPEYAENSVL
jgi:uncharacterized protein YwgA